MTRSNRTDHIRLTSHPEPGGKPRFPIHWGAPAARERGPIIGTVSRPGDRNVIGSHGGSYALYRALAVSSGALDPIRRPDLTNTDPAVEHRPVRAMERAAAASSRSIPGAISSPRAFETGDRRRRRHPPDHRRHQGAARPARNAGRDRGRPARTDGDLVHANGGVARDQGRDRSGLVSARHRRALRHDGNEPAPRAVRADRRHVPRTGHAAGPAGVPAADRRHHGLSVRRRRQARRSGNQDHLPRARRVQRLGRVRLRHLHLPALSHARHRGMRARRAGGRRSASSSTTARKAARSARSPSSWSTTRASGRRAATPRRLFRAHRMRRRRAGRALPAADARRPPLARHCGASTASCR